MGPKLDIEGQRLRVRGKIKGGEDEGDKEGGSKRGNKE